MLRKNLWLIVVGLVLLIGMLIIAAFSIGVYVGEHGWTTDGFQYHPARNQPATQPDGNQFPPNTPPGRPQIIGRVQHITQRTMRIATQKGIRTVLLQEETRYLNANGESIPPDAIQEGDVVAIYGRFAKNDGGQFYSGAIVLLSPPNHQP